MSDMMIDGRGVCDPEPCSTVSQTPTLCRRGIGLRAMFQGQPIPRCDGVLEMKTLSFPERVECPKCHLAHYFFVRNNETLYGALL